MRRIPGACAPETLTRIDPRDASIEFLGRTGTGGRLAFAGNDVYLGGTESLRRIRNLLTRASEP